jgi:hypothetical protein
MSLSVSKEELQKAIDASKVEYEVIQKEQQNRHNLEMSQLESILQLSSVMGSGNETQVIIGKE